MSDQRKKALVLAKDLKSATWELADVLLEIVEGQLFVQWGFTGRRQYGEMELGISDRTSSDMVAMARWKKSLSPAARKWAASLPPSHARSLLRIVDSSNWREWKAKSAGNCCRQIEGMVRRARPTQTPRGIHIARLQKVAAASRSPLPGKVAELRDHGANVDDVSFVLAVEPTEVRAKTRFVRGCVPSAVYAALRTESTRSGIPIGQLVANVLEMYVGDLERKSA